MPPARRQRKKRIRLLGIWLGAVLALGPAWGIVGTVVGMLRTFAGLAAEDRTGAARQISGGISTALLTTEIGLLACPFGVTLLVISLLGYNKLRAAEKASTTGGAQNS